MTSPEGGLWQLKGWPEKGGEHRGQGLARLKSLLSCLIPSDHILPCLPEGGARLQSEQGNDAENEEEGGGRGGGEVAHWSVEKMQ